MNPLIKWPGGKSNEINKIYSLIPKHKRYIEPFFGGGALFFHLTPQKASINDISTTLMEYYSLIKTQDRQLKELLLSYHNTFAKLLEVCNVNYQEIFDLYNMFSHNLLDKRQLSTSTLELSKLIISELNLDASNELILDQRHFVNQINKMVNDKIQRTVVNNQKKPFSDIDLKNNLLTGFASGYYMYFRDVYNDLNLNRISSPSLQYKVANFYFIREYCYGSMFRYNSKGEFNIPYGGISYNTKNFKNKIMNMFNDDVYSLFKNTDISSSDFEEFFKKSNLTSNDFMFIDPPYDTDFSDYEGRAFTKLDQERLAYLLKRTSAQFLLVIKNTEFINNLYNEDFNILSFDNKYTYNVRSRNERKVEHLIITNLPVI